MSEDKNQTVAIEDRALRFAISRQKCVSWFDVRQLSATAVQTITATIVGSMSGRRELMAALEPDSHESYNELADRDELWLDYVADCGDGWNASYSIAWLIGRDGLHLAENCEPVAQIPSTDCTREEMPVAMPGEIVLPGGSALILGGDQVYPTASLTSYQRRFIDPLTCARNTQAGGRQVFAIPGNHDWYDGLTSFIRLFCQYREARRWFGAWQTRQRRSYFSIKLPHGWWLWGVDMALEDDLDPPQYEYFRQQAEALKPGDQVILAVPAPVWLKVDHAEAIEDPTASRTFDKLRLIISLARKQGSVTVPLILTGDVHYYAHYRSKTSDETRDYVICGGGGAFGLGTTQAPGEVELPRGEVAACKKLFPDRLESAWLRWQVWRFPFVNIAFTTTLVGFQLLILWLLGVSAQGKIGVSGWVGEARKTSSFLTFLLDTLGQVATSPSLVVLLSVIFYGFIAFARSGTRSGGRPTVPSLVGGLHALLQVVGGLATTWILAQGMHWLLVGPAAASGLQGSPLETFADWVSVILAAAISYFYCGFLFGLYLALSHKLFGMHDQEVFSAQGIEDWRSFLRLKVSHDGVTVYPVGLRKSSTDWIAAPGVKIEDKSSSVHQITSVVEIPEGCQRVIDPKMPLAPQLIEPPFTVGRPVAVKQ